MLWPQDNTNAAGGGGGDGGYVDFADDANYMDPAQEEFDLMMKEVTEHLANSEHTANLLFEMMPLCDSWDQVTEDKLVDAIGNEGFHANARDEFGNTLLLVASQYHLHSIINALLMANADVNAQNSMGVCALHLACYKDTMDVGLCDQFLTAGANPNLVEVGYGCTPLHYAASVGDNEMVDLLLGAAANVCVKDARGFTPLDYATEAKNDNTVEKARID